ncbi:MAG TPA: MFS transporter [Azoarcus taiwanensis]|uniref:MFS transporter n=1 Tax=Azoarcus taiwanensis TaxID=666964 RepID=A0A972FFP9_9RHOO|nr:MFS transporter [Azoarcus taiwanensis]NMG01501.1 MFS transporter [Azoarcus taiwanensis]HRQ57710.1 MFS transporter [Azoarcus taiwanensis]
MKKNLWLLAIAQGLFLTNNVVFIAINGLVGLALAPVAWMATLPVMGYVVGGAMSTGLVAASQRRWGRQVSFQLGLLVAFLTALLCAFALEMRSFWLLVAGTVIAGYYSANGQLYRFAAGELADASFREKAVSLVLAGGLIGAVLGPNLANYTRDSFTAPFLGSYLALAVVALVSMVVMAGIRFPAEPVRAVGASFGRPLGEIMRQPVFLVATLGAALGYGVMNLLMAATPLAMDACGMPFSDAALVLEWHVIGMFAPGFVTGHLIKRFGVLNIMGIGVALNGVCIAIALSGQDLHQFLVALFLLGVGWNFLFTGSTTLAMQAYRPEEKDRAQAAINFAVFATMAVTAFASGALVTTQGWALLNMGSIVPVAIMGASLIWLAQRQRAEVARVSAD